MRKALNLMDYFLFAMLGLFLFAYLLYALLKPERF
ncbi:MAG: K(+)-transporting ATPase subunit F [Bryobacteraceae bacterium]